MTRPMITPQISLGNVITLVVLLAGMAATWTRMEAAVGSNSKAIEKIEISSSAMDGRLRIVENAKDVQSAALGNMTRSLDKIEAQQNETNALIRQIYAQLGANRRNEQ